MVLLLLANPLSPGGSINHFANLARSLKREQIRLIVAADFSDVTVSARFDGSGARLVHMPSLASRRMAYIPAVADLVHLLRKERVDIIHTVWAKGDLLGSAAGLIAKVPIQVSSLEVYYLATGRLRQVFYRSMFRLITGRQLDCVIALSPRSAAEFQAQVLFGGRVDVIPLGIDLEKYRPLPPRRADGKTVYGCLGRMIPEKGFDLLLEAFSQVAAIDSGAWLRLGGDGPELAMLQKMAVDLGVSDRVSFVGWVDEIQEFFRGIDVFVFASRPAFDGLPNVILEAMALNRLVVATDVGGVGSAIEDRVTGRIVPPLDVGSLAAAMVLMAGEGESMRGAALVRVHERHEMGAEASAIAALYRSVAMRS